MHDSVGEIQRIIPYLVAALFLLLWVIEPQWSLRRPRRSRINRLTINAVVSTLALVTGGVVIVPLVFMLMDWCAANGYGLLQFTNLWAPLEVTLGFLLMDLTFYYWHRVNHTVPLLWRFHLIHHIDPDLDVSTSFRFHFVEVLYSSAFRTFQIVLLGISPLNYVIYELGFHCATLFHHSNVRLPITVERWLNKIIVTPRMHGIHHSTVQEETDSNFSVIFRWWDWIHKTLRLNVPQGEIAIGVPAYQLAEDNGILRLLVGPFRRQREDWRFADGGEPSRMPATFERTKLLA
ncbi:MAG: sterol desaturase family protein [Deltaproteobacteria bacterium]|nr:sterol desaturase family protein [Deltaproteobacteria bacterium]